MNKLTCFSNIIDDFSVLKGAGILSDSRIDEIKSWVAPEAFTEVKLESGRILKDWRLHPLTSKMYNEANFKDGWGKNYIYRQIIEDLLTAEEIEKINKHANGVWRDKKEAALYEKAEKVAAVDYDGWVFHEGSSYNDGYFESVDEYHSWVEDDNEGFEPDDEEYIKRADYVWAVNERPVCHLNLDRILERATEEAYEDFEIDRLKGTEELKIAIDKFNELNKDHLVYEQNTKKVVLL